MNTKANTGPVSPSELAAHPEALAQIRETYEAFVRRAESDPSVMAAFAKDPTNEFLKDAPKQLKANLSEMQIVAANATLRASEPIAQMQNALLAAPSGDQPAALSDVQMSWGSTLCEIGLWSAIVLALGAAIAFSQGAAIAPLIALDAGIIPVLAAITGLSEATIAAMGAAGGFTFAKLIEAACA
jgi:hypothetical protein